MKQRIKQWYQNVASAVKNNPAAKFQALGIVLGFMFALVAQDAMASTSMPWEKPLCAVATSMDNVVARAAAVIAIIIAGLMMAFGELKGIFQTIMGLVAGTSMALLGTSWLTFLGKDGGETYCSGFASLDILRQIFA